MPFLRAGVFDAQNLVTIPHAKLIRPLGTLGSAQLAVVEQVVGLWLGLPATSSESNLGLEPSRPAVLCDHVATARGSSRTLGGRHQERDRWHSIDGRGA